LELVADKSSAGLGTSVTGDTGLLRGLAADVELFFPVGALGKDDEAFWVED
jgi:hypothetical protein